MAAGDRKSAVRMFAAKEQKLVPLGEDAELIKEAIWIDLLRPSAGTEARIESAIGLDVPTQEEMREIEISSRLYVENDAAYMTAMILSHTDADDVVVSPITFILTGRTLITVRYEEPRVFDTFAERAQRVAMGCQDAEGVLVGLLEGLVDRLADVLERAAGEIDNLARDVFQYEAVRRGEPPRRPRRKKPREAEDYQRLLGAIGRKYDLTSNIRDSLVTIERLASFLLHVAIARKAGKDITERVKTLVRDADALSDHVDSVSQKIIFLLDATLGMVNIEQNAIIKIFSVAAVVFLPPTLIASVYGMNFEFMPELSWPYGYPLAVGLMVLSAILPYLFFKTRGWL
jgi:magnesium transporter